MPGSKAGMDEISSLRYRRHRIRGAKGTTSRLILVQNVFLQIERRVMNKIRLASCTRLPWCSKPQQKHATVQCRQPTAIMHNSSTSYQLSDEWRNVASTAVAPSTSLCTFNWLQEHKCDSTFMQTAGLSSGYCSECISPNYSSSGMRWELIV